MPSLEILFSYLNYVNSAIITLAAIEGVILWRVRRQSYDWRAALVSFFDCLFRRYVVQAHLRLGIVGPLSVWVWHHRLVTMPLDTAAAFVVLFVSQEFCLYWHHRLQHRVRWLWAHHAVHHTSNQLGLAAGFRFGWTAELTASMFFYLPLVWLGFPPMVVVFAVWANLLYQVWIHTDLISKLGWLEYVLNTPSHHRVHHAANPEYLDANYGGILIVFDRLFGTFKPERNDLPCRLGLIEPLRSNNPVVVEFHEWAALIVDLWRARSWGERWRYFLGAPGWKPDTAVAAAPAFGRAVAQ